MAQFTQLFISGDFASGVTYYDDYYPGQEGATRMVVTIVVESVVSVQAIVDTGAPWCILAPGIFPWLGRMPPGGDDPYEVLNVRGIRYEGRLSMMDISVKADYGESFTVNSTVFVPSLHSGEIWPYPNFIGLDGFLNRIRYAIDPAENAFYFGPI